MKKKKSSNRRWKSLSLKVQHLQLELEEREELMRMYEEQFLRAMQELDVEELPAKQPESVIKPVVVDATNVGDDIIEPERPPEGPEEMKQLWRSIAIMTHPDKTQGNEERADMYKRANEAWRSGDYGTLYAIAIELDIEPPDTETSYVVLESMTQELENKIKEKEKSVLWEWGRASGEAKREILDLYLLSRGKKRKSF